MVVDACQMRLRAAGSAPISIAAIWCWSRARNFSAGRPSAARCWCRRGCRQALAATEGSAAGLADYASRSDWPKRWTALRARFASRANFGQWLRWEAALEEIRAYYEVPAAFRAMALRELSAGIESLIALSPSLRLIGAGAGTSVADDEEFREATIFPFTIERQRPCAFGGRLPRALPGAGAGSERRDRGSARRPRHPRAPLPDRPAGADRAAARASRPRRFASASARGPSPRAGRRPGRRRATICIASSITSQRRVAKIELLLTHTDVTELTELSHGH